MNFFVVCLVDGGWSPWSSWFICEQQTGEKCQCRTRSCTQPKPQFNGKICPGNALEIFHCEGMKFSILKQRKMFVVHGGWSPWSSWSMCPQICGKTFRFRTRTCTNPSPKNHGRLCIGSEREEEPCPERICSQGNNQIHFSPFCFSFLLRLDRMDDLFEIMWKWNTKTNMFDERLSR